MNKKIPLIFIIIYIIFLSNIIFSHPQFPLKIKENKIIDSKGRKIILKSINLSDRNKYPPFLPEVTFDDLKMIRKLTFNSVRFLIMWEAIEPEKGKFDFEYLNKLKEWIKKCDEAGLLVILDMHQDLFSRAIGGNGAPQWATIDNLVEPDECKSPWYINYFNKEVIASFDNFWKDKDLQEHFFKSWEQVVKETLKFPNVIGYDLFNEPYPCSYSRDFFESKILTNFYKKLISLIKKQAPDKFVFFEPSVYVSAGFNTYLKKLNFKNIIYAPHYYDALTNVTPFGYDGDTMRIKNCFKKFLFDAKRLDCSLFLGEYGVFDWSVKGAKEYLQDVISAIQENKIGSAYWNYNRDVDETSVVDKEGQERYIVEMVSYPYPQAVPGILKSYSAKGRKTLFITIDVKNKKLPLEIVFYYDNELSKIEGEYKEKIEVVEKHSKVLKIYFYENKKYDLKIYWNEK